MISVSIRRSRGRTSGLKLSHRNGLAVLAFIAILLWVHPVTGQTKTRLIPFPNWSLDYYDDEVSLELVEIKVAGRPVALDESFEADGNWLKNMTLRVKNIGTKPIASFGIGGGLLSGITEELPAYASFQYGIGWNWGRYFNPDKRKPKGRVMKPGETVELSYGNVASLVRSVLAKEGEGAFCKLKFMAPVIQYADGSSPFTPPMRFRKTL